MARVPLLAGSKVAVVPADGLELLRPPAPVEPIADVGAAVREALRYPLSGLRLAALAERGGRATVVLEPPSLPLPGAQDDPRQDALAAVLGELERLGLKTTLLLAGGLEQRVEARRLDALLHPADARAFRGEARVHDVESERLRAIGEADGVPLRVASELVDTDLVVVVSAAETAVHGGPATLLRACGAAAARAATADSLLETASAPGWRLAVALERLLAARTPVLGLSLVLDLPRTEGRYRDYPHAPGTAERLASSPGRRALNALPRAARVAVLQRLSRRLGAVAVLAGPPSVAHAEALLRGVALRGTRVERPLDAIVVPLPWKAPHQPRRPLNPVTAAATALGLALRLWRDAFPLAPGGTCVLLHHFSRAFDAPAAPYRVLFEAVRSGREPGALAAAEAAAASDPRALDAYRAGRAPHPLLPFQDWAGCAPTLDRLGTVIVAGCRDATAARALGFVPTHNVQAALDMARGLGGDGARVGVLLAPPYPALLGGP